MSLNDQPTHYEVLDLKPEASPQEIREAYIRIKATYNKDSVALYTLVSAEEREQTLRQIEDAYDVLSSPEKRRQYDRSHGLIDSMDPRGDERVRMPPGHKVISIDRIPPMEAGGSEEDLLVPPNTDFSANKRASPFDAADVAVPATPPAAPSTPPLRARPPVAPAMASAPPTPPPASSALPPPLPPSAAFTSPPLTPPGALRSTVAESQASLAREISAEVNWTGEFLRKVREARRISLEEMSAATKITKTYILAIEEENFSRLPAPVYVRGFVSQIARILKLPNEKVSNAYMGRFLAADGSSSGSPKSK